MKDTILQLHEEMDLAIARTHSPASDTTLTEQCYQIVAHYWQRVKQHIRQTGFPDDAAEIDFFKNVKAKFTAPLEYYLLLYRYHVYAEAGDSVLDQFRKDETDRIRKFRETHAPFINYFEQGRTEWDDLYFLRRKFNKAQRPPSQVYDRANDLWTNGDWILTLLHANRDFEQFLRSGPH